MKTYKPVRFSVNINETDYMLELHNTDEGVFYSCREKDAMKAGTGKGIITALIEGLDPVDLSYVTLRNCIDWNQMLTVDLQDGPE